MSIIDLNFPWLVPCLLYSMQAKLFGPIPNNEKKVSELKLLCESFVTNLTLLRSGSEGPFDQV